MRSALTRQVLDRAGGARLATLFAATYPERAAGLVLFDPTAKGRKTDDYPWALGDEDWRVRLAELRDGWGRTDLKALLEEWSPQQRDDPEFEAWFVNHMRRGLSPGSALAFFRMMRDSDVSDVLPAVNVPTVVLSSETERGPGSYVAERIPGARLVELPASLRSIYHWVDDDAHEIAVRETRDRGRGRSATGSRPGARNRPLHGHRRLDRACG